jgi:hypothetical protein
VACIKTALSQTPSVGEVPVDWIETDPVVGPRLPRRGEHACGDQVRRAGRSGGRGQKRASLEPILPIHVALAFRCHRIDPYMPGAVPAASPP